MISHVFPSPAALAELQRTALAVVDECVVGALIADASGRIFAQKRSAHRRLFPNCWDIAGGHVEPGESLLAALHREVLEETGWSVRRAELLHTFDWSVTQDGRTLRKREFDFLVAVDGDLSAPQFETDKHTAYRWFGPADLPLLRENRAPADTLIADLIALALRHQPPPAITSRPS